MEEIVFDSGKEFSYHWCGRFLPPSNDWIHLTRNLTDYELMVVTEGTLYVADSQNEYTVNAGEYLLMTPDIYQHGFKAGAASFYWLHFGYNNDQNNHCLEPEKGPYVPGIISIPRKAELSSPDRIIILMKQLMDSDKRYREETLNRYLVGTILAEIAASSRTRHTFGVKAKGEQTMSDIEDYISWHIAEPLKVSDVANYFGYNEKYLTTFFRKRFGISLKQYILNKKFERAKAILTETSTPVSQIAYSLGWQDAHNFSNAFRHATNLSPGLWRETYNKHNVFQK